MPTEGTAATAAATLEATPREHRISPERSDRIGRPRCLIPRRPPGQTPRQDERTTRPHALERIALRPAPCTRTTWPATPARVRVPQPRPQPAAPWPIQLRPRQARRPLVGFRTPTRMVPVPGLGIIALTAMAMVTVTADTAEAMATVGRRATIVLLSHDCGQCIQASPASTTTIRGTACGQCMPFRWQSVSSRTDQWAIPAEDFHP